MLLCSSWEIGFLKILLCYLSLLDHKECNTYFIDQLFEKQ